MPLIDDDGTLLGIVNVIDALAIVLVVAVIVAGISLGGVSSGGESETRYATIELGQQPEYVVDRIGEGDVATFDGSDDSITVRDVRVIPPTGEENNTQHDVTIWTEVNGELVEGDFRVAGDSFLLGDEIQLDMREYTTNGTVTDLEHEATASNEETTTSTTVAVDLQNVPPTVSDALEEGMSETFRGETIAQIETIESEPAAVVLESEDGDIYEREHPQNEDVTLTVELRTTETDTGLHFRGERLGVGTPIVFDFDVMIVDGEVAAIE